MARTPKPHFILAADFGGSLTKVWYQHRAGQPKLLTMEPETIVTDQTAIARFNSSAVGAAASVFGPDGRCWTQPLDEQGDPIPKRVGATGSLGQHLAYVNTLNLAKSEKALYKLLGVIWVAQQELIKDGCRIPDDFKVAIRCLLPPDEHRTFDKFSARVKSVLRQGFLTPTGVLRPELFGGFNCYPEGLGLAQSFKQKHPRVKDAVVFMLGHRNATAVLIRDGKASKFNSSNLGFNACLKEIQGVHGVKPESLLRAVFSARRQGNLYPYYQIAPYQSTEYKEHAARDMCNEFDKASQLYCTALGDWMNDVLSQRGEFTDVVFCGGTTNAIRHYLNTFRRDLRHHYDAGVEVPEQYVPWDLVNRLEDSYETFAAMQSELRFPATEKTSQQLSHA